ncbi:MAG TPA: DUF952 domain-containing protein [Rugosimonospora sp.]|nr:DUF952 domain-containing protein [Rugosimonospora sp.]
MIYHFCPAETWAAAVAAGEYTADTLATEGFIHLSGPEQVHLPANALARGRSDLVLLEVDEARLPQPVRYEDGGDGMLFPHLYAPLPVSAVVAVHDFPPNPDGTFTLPPSVAPPGGSPAGGLGGSRA